jgi:hypothetical protein
LSKKLKNEESDERSKGIMLVWSPPYLAQRPCVGPDLAPWSGAPSPCLAGGPPSHSAYKRMWRLGAQDKRFTVAASTQPRNPTNQGGVASDRKLHRCRHCSTASPPVAALAQSFTSDPVMTGSSLPRPKVWATSLSLPLSLHSYPTFYQQQSKSTHWSTPRMILSLLTVRASRPAATLACPPGVPHQQKWQKRRRFTICNGNYVGARIKLGNKGVPSISMANS